MADPKVDVELVLVYAPRGWFKEVTRSLDRLERHLGTVQHDQRTEERIMGKLDDELDGIEAAEATEHDDIQRIIADLEAKATDGTITDAEAARLDALKTAIAADTAAIDAGDPAPVTPADPSTGDAPVK